MIEPPTLQPSRRDRVLVLALQVTATLILAAIVHLASILSLPRRSEHGAYARVSTLVGRVPLKTVALPSNANTSFPYRDPALATAFCVYNLAVAPTRISVDVGGADFVAVSFHSRDGVTFYGLTNRSASNKTVSMTLMTPQQLALAVTRDTGDEAITELRVAAPEPEGFVQVDALATAPSAMAGAEASAQKLSCSAVQLP